MAEVESGGTALETCFKDPQRSVPGHLEDAACEEGEDSRMPPRSLACWLVQPVPERKRGGGLGVEGRYLGFKPVV